MLNRGSSSPFAGESTIGVRFDRMQGEVRACWLRFPGFSTDFSPPQIVAVQAEAIPAPLLRSLFALNESDTSADIATASLEVTDAAVSLCQGLIREMGEEFSNLLAVGCHGGGMWSDVGGHRIYVELLQASRLAEQIGVSVVDDFPGCDLAQDGWGGPVESMGLSVVLPEETSAIPGRRWRAALELSSRVAHVAVLHGLRELGSDDVIPSFNACIGTNLFTALIEYVAKRDGVRNNITFPNDGSVIPGLPELWASSLPDLAGWNPEGFSPLALIYALNQSHFGDARIEDLLFSAAQFLAASIAERLVDVIPTRRPIGELLVVDECSDRHGVTDALESQLPGVSVRRVSDIRDARTLHAASIAALAMLHLWRIPVASTNPGGVARVWGRITPGSPANWQRVLETMTCNAPWLLPLRSAI